MNYLIDEDLDFVSRKLDAGFSAEVVADALRRQLDQTLPVGPTPAAAEFRYTAIERRVKAAMAAGL